jgi:hypothetical protein
VSDQWAELPRLRRLTEELTARLEFLHGQALAQADVGSDDPLEWALRRARHQAHPASRALHDAVEAAQAELVPQGRVRR